MKSWKFALPLVLVAMASWVCLAVAHADDNRPDVGHLWCACHNGHFDLNGINIAGPPLRPLEAFSVNVRGGQIVVSKGA